MNLTNNKITLLRKLINEKITDLYDEIHELELLSDELYEEYEKKNQLIK